MNFMVYYDNSWERYFYITNRGLLFENETPILITPKEQLAKIVTENLNKGRIVK